MTSARPAAATSSVDTLRPQGATDDGELHLARETFRRAFEMSLVGMAIVGLDGRYQAVNDTLCRILGRTESELLAISPGDITHPDDRQRDLVLMERLSTGDVETFRVDKRYVGRDGGEIWVALHASIVHDIDGQPLYMLGQIEDLRTARTALQETRRIETELATLAASLPIGIYRADPQGRCVYANDRWREIYGIDGAIVDGWEWQRAIHPDDLARALAEISDGSTTSGAFGTSFRICWPSGEVRWVRATANAVLDDDGNAANFVGSVEDVTDRVTGEVHLAEATLRFGRAFDNAPIGMALVAPDGTWLAVNSSLCQLLGYSEPELKDLTFQDVTHPDDLDSDLELVRQVLAGEIDTYSLEKRYFHRSGVTVWVNLSVSLVQDALGEPLYFVSQIEDVTQRRLGDERLTRYAQRLASTNSELVEFTSVAAHDLAEPLRVIEGYLHLLRTRCADDLSDDGRIFIGHAVAGAERLQNLINDLLAYSRATQQSGRFAPVELDDVVASSITAVSRLIDETTAVVIVDPLPVVTGNDRQLAQLFQNLIANAVKFSRPGEAPHIELTANRHDGAWVVSITDRGIGIPPEHRERVFGMFKRLHARDVYPGTGIGLAICRKVVESHGGRIWVADDVKGTTICVSFPDRPEGGPQ